MFMLCTVVSVHESIYIKYNVRLCVCMWVSRLYELFTQKYSSSVQVVYSSTVYMYMNLYIYKVLCLCVFVSHLYEFLIGPFRFPERRFEFLLSYWFPK